MMQKRNLRGDLRESYDRHARERESSPVQDWKVEERSVFLSTLQNAHARKFLELGAGTGRDSKYFQDQGFEVACIDLSPVMVDLCRQKGLNAQVMDMDRLDFPEESFDAVYSMNSLLHLTKAEFPGVLRRINAILRPDGMAYIGVYGGYNHEGTWDDDSYTPRRFFSFFSDEALVNEVTGVFDVLKFQRVFFGPDDPIHFQSLILKKRPARQRAGNPM